MGKRTATAADVIAWQVKHDYKRHCAYCVREFYESLVRVCPVSGREICMYCCRSCEESIREFGGQGCAAGTRERRKEA
ncbi:MAG: hypothetical protein IKO91_00645 [Oscillospiraceae bacterium]|nr:hypothetical protein [Oscillospiraceae bacterium]